MSVEGNSVEEASADSNMSCPKLEFSTSESESVSNWLKINWINLFNIFKPDSPTSPAFEKTENDILPILPRSGTTKIDADMSKSIIEDLESDITQPTLVMDTQASPEAFFSAEEDEN